MFGNTQNLSGDDPAHYRICTSGVFDAHWLGLLSGVWVITEHSCADPRITTFVGCVPDQAALMGVLEQLYCLGLPILLVEWLVEGQA